MGYLFVSAYRATEANETGPYSEAPQQQCWADEVLRQPRQSRVQAGRTAVRWTDRRVQLRTRQDRRHREALRRSYIPVELK